LLPTTHMPMSRITKLFLATMVCCLPAIGCGDRLSALSGTVTIDGQPAPKGLSFEFSPTGPGSSSYAATDANGRYEAAFTFRQKGIQPGEHRVRLIPSEVEIPMPEIGPDGKPIGVPAGPSLVAKLPRKYYEQIELITVLPGRNTHDIVLSTASE
jgi:hypothetical protein